MTRNTDNFGHQLEVQVFGYFMGNTIVCPLITSQNQFHFSKFQNSNLYNLCFEYDQSSSFVWFDRYTIYKMTDMPLQDKITKSNF